MEMQSDGSNRVNRGGSWNNNARNCRSANRNNNSPSNSNNNLGFRLALVPAQGRTDVFIEQDCVLQLAIPCTATNSAGYPPLVGLSENGGALGQETRGVLLEPRQRRGGNAELQFGGHETEATASRRRRAA